MIRMVEQRGIRWAEHVARMEQLITTYKILVGKIPFVKPHAEKGRILKLIFMK
jgi:hypothetical protein